MLQSFSFVHSTCKCRAILELSDLGHRIGSFSTTQYYAKVGKLKVNNNQVMCHLSMKLSDTFDQNPPCTLTMPQGAINMPSTKKMSRDSPNYLSSTDLSNML